MSDIDVDAETTRAIAAIERRIADADGADPAYTARAIMAELRAKGWRPTPAVATSWKDHQRGGGGLPVGDEARQAIAAYRASVAERQSADAGDQP